MTSTHNLKTIHRGSGLLLLALSAGLWAAAIRLPMLSAVAAPADNTYAGMPGEQGDTFNWFDTLGFPDVKGCKFVRVGTGGWSQDGNKPPRKHYAHAFLLKTETNGFLACVAASETAGIGDQARTNRSPPIATADPAQAADGEPTSAEGYRRSTAESGATPDRDEHGVTVRPPPTSLQIRPEERDDLVAQRERLHVSTFAE